MSTRIKSEGIALALLADPGLARSGAVVVRDARRCPRRSKQCKDGGYLRFGFRNQGQCVKSIVSPP